MEHSLKQRLIGAIVLVALAVIFIPMLLEGPDQDLVPEMAPLPEPEKRVVTLPLEQFPQADDVAETPAVSVVEGEPAAAPETPAEEPGTPAPVGSEPEPEKNQSPDTPGETDAGTLAAAPAEVDEAPAAKPGPLGNWVVQVGSFSSEQNALRLRDRLREKGYATQVEQVVVGGKTHFRVRVGPYLERAEADEAQGKLTAAFDLKARVLAYP